MATISELFEISLLAEYFNKTDLHDEIGYAIGSLLSSSWYMAKTCSASLCGISIEDECEIRQWIEYYCTKVRTSLPWQRLPREQLHNVLEKLNSHLLTRLHFCGCGFTLADILFYYGLYKYMIDMSYQEKQKFINVSRWFDYIQHYPNLKPFTWSIIACPRIQ